MADTRYAGSNSANPTTPVRLDQCPLAATFDALGGKWKAPIIWWLGKRPRHFGELRRQLPGISAKVLTQQLRELEADGVIRSREWWSGRVRRVRYDLTDRGTDLLPGLQALCVWGRQWQQEHPGDQTVDAGGPDERAVRDRLGETA